MNFAGQLMNFGMVMTKGDVRLDFDQTPLIDNSGVITFVDGCEFRSCVSEVHRTSHAFMLSFRLPWPCPCLSSTLRFPKSLHLEE